MRSKRFTGIRTNDDRGATHRSAIRPNTDDGSLDIGGACYRYPRGQNLRNSREGKAGFGGWHARWNSFWLEWDSEERGNKLNEGTDGKHIPPLLPRFTEREEWVCGASGLNCDDEGIEASRSPGPNNSAHNYGDQLRHHLRTGTRKELRGPSASSPHVRRVQQAILERCAFNTRHEDVEDDE
ncbi:hypothetical protein Hypma_004952 [Hypsizygus marmoreus]|uniref:Uncharacterized protein n=1 Tax=Hypsizygus marmoreus TaxID=39966 RepID=A0A369JX60_HYPMA|nr:hypothetical protein Hypma_004952 [Hypsizygus marmoreus]